MVHSSRAHSLGNCFRANCPLQSARQRAAAAVIGFAAGQLRCVAPDKELVSHRFDRNPETLFPIPVREKSQEKRYQNPGNMDRNSAAVEIELTTWLVLVLITST